MKPKRFEKVYEDGLKKKAIVEALLEGPDAVADKMGIPRSTLRSWLKKAGQEQRAGIVPRVQRTTGISGLTKAAIRMLCDQGLDRRWAAENTDVVRLVRKATR